MDTWNHAHQAVLFTLSSHLLLKVLPPSLSNVATISSARIISAGAELWLVVVTLTKGSCTSQCGGFRGGRARNFEASPPATEGFASSNNDNGSENCTLNQLIGHCVILPKSQTTTCQRWDDSGKVECGSESILFEKYVTRDLSSWLQSVRITRS